MIAMMTDHDNSDSESEFANDNFEDSRVELRAMGHNLVSKYCIFRSIHQNV
jgi:hypothetical protein